MNIIAENIMRRRKELNMTQRELADKLNVSDKTVSRWETGKQVPDALVIPELAKMLDMSIDELYGMNRIVEEMQTEEPIQHEKVTVFKLVLLIATSVYFFINCSACMPLGMTFCGMSFIGIVIVLFATVIVFRDFYRKKANANDYELEEFRWLGLIVVFIDFVIAVWVPLIKNPLNYTAAPPLRWLLFVTIVNLLLLGVSVWYRNYLRRKGMIVQKNTVWLLSVIGVLGIVVVISCKLYQMRYFQAARVIFEGSTFADRLRLFELAAGVLFVLMQGLNYMLLLRTWKKKTTNKKVLWACVGAFAICSIVVISVQVKTYFQHSLYNELSKHAAAEGVENVSVASVSIGVDFGIGADVYTYFTLGQNDHIEELFDLFHDIKVEEGESKEQVEGGKSCRIQFQHYLYEDGEYETLSWDVTLMESGEMWYRGEKYQVANVDWDALCRLAISEYNGVNQDLYEELLK